ncbi:metabotropic glutamate receptor-like [Anastrepha ludens]|uniref:metabotropic glutamate receptor-like n=1 Tax=Anastrepha ludens TaxID=28586 RepID=UPI0023B1C472|nr:metabotropic glutamate receptor-like [Anastrepha ludens]
MANYDGKDFYNNYLLNVSFIDLAGSVVKFDRQGDGLARYDILNYQRLENSSGYHYKVFHVYCISQRITMTERTHIHM